MLNFVGSNFRSSSEEPQAKHVSCEALRLSPVLRFPCAFLSR